MITAKQGQSLKSRLAKAVASRKSRIQHGEAQQALIDKSFDDWVKSILHDVDGVKFEHHGKKCEVYLHRVGPPRRSVCALIRECGESWPTNRMSRHAPWHIELASFYQADDDLWQVNIKERGQHLPFKDKDGDTDCYSRPENRTQRITEIKQWIEDELVKFAGGGNDDLGGKIDEIAKQQKESNRLTEINAAKIDQLIEINGLTPPEAD